MINQVLEKSGKRRDSQVVERAEKTVPNALKMSTVKGQWEAVRSVAALAIW